LSEISPERIRVTLHEAGFRWQKSRTGLPIGRQTRKRKWGIVAVIDADAAQRRTD
jgi:hypothetical protein